jgi:hypothetical protein
MHSASLKWVRGLCALLALSGSSRSLAQDFQVDGSGNVDATSFAGDGSGLTGVPLGSLFQGATTFDCFAGNTCFVVTDCAEGTFVTGGGFFLGTSEQADRALVTLHQTYRLTVTQWLSEATNNSAVTIPFWSTPSCAPVVADEPFDPTAVGPAATAERPQTYLMCPAGDVAYWVDAAAAHDPIFCPNHGLELKGSGGGVGSPPLPRFLGHTEPSVP